MIIRPPKRPLHIDLTILFGIIPAVVGCGSTGATSGKTWEAQLTVSETGENNGYASSSRLAVSWTPPSKTLDHYVIVATESIGSTSVEAMAAATENSATLTELKAGTTYAVSLTACLDEDCNSSLTARENSVEGTTEEEYWELQGSGDSVSELTRIVSDGNSKLAAMVYGEGAGSAGLINPSTATSLIDEINTGQGVPLGGSLGERIRLYFEATGSDNKTRILYVDSQDGYVGRDFNAGSGDSVCDTAAEAEKVDFEDWESEDGGRNVHFLWPSGAEMDATDEGYIDDFMAIIPTADLSFQVFYVVITDGSIAPITVAAVLLNP